MCSPSTTGKSTWPRADPTRPDMFDAYSILAAVAVVTTKVWLGPGFTPLVYYNPGRLARTIATIDHISNGRFILGAGVAANRDEEWKAYNMEYYAFNKRFRMMQESIRLMKKLWTVDGSITFKGKYYKVTNAPAWPKPVQKPYPPIWYGGSGPTILEEIGKNGDGWGPTGIGTRLSPVAYTEKMNQIKSFAKQAGRDSGRIVFSGHAIISMEKTADRAFEVMKAYRGGQDIPEEETKNSIIGTTDDCITGIERYAKAGLNHMVLNPYPHPDDLTAWFIAFKEKIIPYFK